MDQYYKRTSEFAQGRHDYTLKAPISEGSHIWDKFDIPDTLDLRQIGHLKLAPSATVSDMWHNKLNLRQIESETNWIRDKLDIWNQLAPCSPVSDVVTWQIGHFWDNLDIPDTLDLRWIGDPRQIGAFFANSSPNWRLLRQLAPSSPILRFSPSSPRSEMNWRSQTNWRLLRQLSRMWWHDKLDFSDKLHTSATNWTSQTNWRLLRLSQMCDMTNWIWYKLDVWNKLAPSAPVSDVVTWQIGHLRQTGHFWDSWTLLR